MKRKNDEETFAGALLGDWRAFKDYYQSGEFWQKTIKDFDSPYDEGWLMYALIALYVVQAVAYMVLSVGGMAALSGLCGIGIFLAFIIPLAPCWVLYRYARFKAEQWKRHNE